MKKSIKSYVGKRLHELPKEKVLAAMEVFTAMKADLTEEIELKGIERKHDGTLEDEYATQDESSLEHAEMVIWNTFCHASLRD